MGVRLGLGLGLRSYLRPGKVKKSEAAGEKHNDPTSTNNSALVVPSLTPMSSLSESALGSRVASKSNSEVGCSAIDVNEMKCDVMANYLRQQQQELMWTQEAKDEGIVLKKSRGQYTCCPSDLADNPYGFAKAIEMMGVKVCYTTPYSARPRRKLTKSLA